MKYRRTTDYILFIEKNGKDTVFDCLTLYFPLNKDHLTDLYFFDFVPFFADFAAFFFAAIFIYIEKGTYISFLILKIKNVNLV